MLGAGGGKSAAALVAAGVWLIGLLQGVASFGFVPSEPLPSTIKDTIASMRQATQDALQSRQSRMDIEMPYGMSFGIEKATKDKKLDPERSDRELCRMYIEMFSMIEEATVVVFKTEGEADRAKKTWGPAVKKAKVLSFSGGGGSSGGGGVEAPKQVCGGICKETRSGHGLAICGNVSQAPPEY